MTNPFKKITDNAKNTKNVQQHLGVKTSTVMYTINCETCGAPRPKKTNLSVCDYCRSPFMKTSTIITSDF